MIEHHGRGYVYSLQYHLVWCTKYRKDILHGAINKTLKESLLKIASDNNFVILELATPGDHVHLLIDCSPQHALPNIIKALKGSSSRILFKAHPELKDQLWDGAIWNPSYYVGTVSENTETQIVNYINNQKTE